MVYIIPYYELNDIFEWRTILFENMWQTSNISMKWYLFDCCVFLHPFLLGGHIKLKREIIVMFLRECHWNCFWLRSYVETPNIISPNLHFPLFCIWCLKSRAQKKRLLFIVNRVLINGIKKSINLECNLGEYDIDYFKEHLKLLNDTPKTYHCPKKTK